MISLKSHALLAKMGFKRLEDIDAWKRGCRLAVEIYKITAIGKFERIGDCETKSGVRQSQYPLTSPKDLNGVRMRSSADSLPLPRVPAVN